MLTENSVVDKIEVLVDGQIQVRRADMVLRDGVVISTTNHRHVISPGDDYSAEDAKVQAICAVVHTPDVVAAYKTSIGAL